MSFWEFTQLKKIRRRMRDRGPGSGRKGHRTYRPDSSNASKKQSKNEPYEYDWDELELETAAYWKISNVSSKARLDAAKLGVKAFKQLCRKHMIENPKLLFMYKQAETDVASGKIETPAVASTIRALYEARYDELTDVPEVEVPREPTGYGQMVGNVYPTGSGWR